MLKRLILHYGLIQPRLVAHLERCAFLIKLAKTSLICGRPVLNHAMPDLSIPHNHQNQSLASTTSRNDPKNIFSWYGVSSSSSCSISLTNCSSFSAITNSMTPLSSGIAPLVVHLATAYQIRYFIFFCVTFR